MRAISRCSTVASMRSASPAICTLTPLVERPPPKNTGSPTIPSHPMLPTSTVSPALPDADIEMTASSGKYTASICRLGSARRALAARRTGLSHWRSSRYSLGGSTASR